MATSSITSALPHSPSSGIKALARFGFAAKGVVYLVLGTLAVMAATGVQGGKTADKKQVLQTIQDLPFGRFLLGLVAFGLLGYVIWRLVQAFRDTEDKGSDAKGLARRLGYAGSGLLYAGLAFAAGRTAFSGGAANQGGGSTQQSMTAKLLAQPYGQWLVGAIALGIIGAGLYQIYRAYSGNFAKHVNSSSLPADQQKIVFRTGQIGYTARGIVMAIIGYFVLQAALHSNSGKVQGTEGAFDLLAGMGPVVLAIVALGLMAYGVYMLVQAKYPVLRGV
ncbi:protein of unknown function DUF1206 [Hymenobacter roseosalivarius DSM 11622]|uniref:DUF1206 domain-containing protein n=1 Tax=Hymenobacter roseosalivarius DSM 11622 TaxID=645990 RepID=A0A1W1VNN3_9BACT|nr:DUF1206 domain-containing protein [Hymenobacter roseosalivarius]SMB94979.1 protein of unknown function DUF1206 [Hymenobacter roseosalivarius DSM 11622]